MRKLIRITSQENPPSFQIQHLLPHPSNEKTMGKKKEKSSFDSVGVPLSTPGGAGAGTLTPQAFFPSIDPVAERIYQAPKSLFRPHFSLCVCSSPRFAEIPFPLWDLVSRHCCFFDLALYWRLNFFSKWWFFNEELNDFLTFFSKMR